MKATDQLLTAVLILTVKATGKSLDEVISLYERAGLVDHTYAPAAGGATVQYNFTPKFQALIGGIE